MSGYLRTTRECSVTQVQPNLYQAIRDYFQKHQLGDPATEIQTCCETRVARREKGKLATFLEGNPDTVSHLVLLLTTDWFIWASHGDRSGTMVYRMKLIGLQVKTNIKRRTNNLRLEISGIVGDTRDYVRGSLEIGPEPASRKFCEEVKEAVSRVTPPDKKNRLGWFGG